MTIIANLSNLIDGWIYRRRWNAMRVYNLLHTYPVVKNLKYDGRFTVTARRFYGWSAYTVQVSFTRTRARISFPSRFSNELQIITTAASPQLGEAIAALIAGLLTAGIDSPQLSTDDEPLSSVDGTAVSATDMEPPHCCSWPMVEGDPEVWFFPGEPVRVERVYRCTECDWVTNIEVIDRVEADRLASEVVAR